MATRQSPAGDRPGHATMRRRGILAAAGAVVAGIVAKQTAQPVAANTTMLIANTETAGFLNAVVGHSGLIGSGSSRDAVLVGDAGTGSAQAGIMGTTLAEYLPTEFCAVYGRSNNAHSVFGNAANGIGVKGQSGGPVAMQGLNQSAGAGGIGVLGQSTNGYGVQGQSTTTIGVFGATNGSGQVAGVYGVSNASYGVIGFTTAAGYSGVTAITGTANVAALAATSTLPNAYAAYFTGTTIVQGDFVAFGGSKSAAVKDASGQHRLVYCVESPEAWFEDFGTGTLVNGNASVALDKTFTEIVHTDAYHVFLTPEGDFHAHVTAKSATGFAVQQTTGTGSAGASGRFSWRVVAKRKDITGERLARFAPPKINHPDPDKLPKPEPIPPIPPSPQSPPPAPPPLRTP